jgi:preprotein translocase subunit SecY
MYQTDTAIAPFVIFFQLIAAGIILLLLDEMIQKGWGLGSGISLFIMAGVAQNILWMSFNPAFGGGLFVGGLSALLAGGEYTLTHWILGTGVAGSASLIGFIAPSLHS